MNAVFVTESGGSAASRKSRSPFGPVAAYVIAAGAGGVATGLVLAVGGAAVNGAVPDVVWSGCIAVLVVAGAFSLVLERRRTVAPLWERRAQVPRAWTLWRSQTRTAVGFGLMIGAGVFTFLDHAAAYALAVAVFTFHDPSIGLFVGACYGVTRGASLLLSWIRRSPFQTAGEERLWRGFAATLPGLGAIALAAAVVATIS